MIYEKKILRALEKDLKKHKIRAKAITDAAEEKGKTRELVRLVLKGETPDFNGIIVHLDAYLKKHIKNLTKVSNKIGNY